MSFSEYIAPLIGRLVVAWYFLSQAWLSVHHWHRTVAMMESHHIAAAPLFLLLAIVVMGLGAGALILGFHTKHGAILLFGFTLAMAIVLHDYWDAAVAERASAYGLFARDVAIAGALLFIVGMGPGRFAFDNRGRKQTQ